MPVLLDEEKGVFLYRNIYIIKDDNDIYGVAVLSDNKTVPMPLETYFQRFKNAGGNSR